ncbi:MAG TPA: HAMP domain-containing sensor histidine kinase [Candidatus Obscuribacterales bacterium]
MKIWQRGVLLILFPLVCDGIGFAFLQGALQESQRLIDEERHQVQLLQTIDETLTNFLQASIYTVRDIVTPTEDRKFTTMGIKRLKKVLKNLKKLRELSRSDPAIIELVDSLEQRNLPQLEKIAQDQSATGLSKLVLLQQIGPTLVDANKTNSLCLKLLERQRAKQGEARQRQVQSEQNLHALLNGLLVLNITWLVVAVSIFHLSISRRLRLLVTNARRLSRLDRFESRLRGNDEFVELDASLNEALEKLTAAKDFRENIVSMVVHDLRTPLTAIGTSLELLKNSPKAELNDMSMRKVKAMSGNVDRLIELINNFLDVEKLQLGRLTLSIEDVAVTSVIEESFNALNELAAAKEIQLTHDCPPSVLVRVDRQKIHQVLINFLSNAIKFSPSGSQVSVRVRLADPSPQWVRIEVADQGSGLTAATIEKLFHKFGDSDKGNPIKGSGLGLFITKWFVESHGGKVGVESEEGKGSTFWFTVPSANNSDASGKQHDSISMETTKNEKLTLN